MSMDKSIKEHIKEMQQLESDTGISQNELKYFEEHLERIEDKKSNE